MADDAQTTVSIQQAGEYRVMYVDGQHQANTTPEMVGYHRLLGTLPVAVHPDPRAGPGDRSRRRRQPGCDERGARHRGHRRRALARGVSKAPSSSRTPTTRSPTSRTSRSGSTTDATTCSSPTTGTTSSPPTSSRPTTPAPASCGRSSTGSSRATPWRRAGSWCSGRRRSTTATIELIVRSFQSVFPHATAWVSGSMLIGSNEPLRLDRAVLEAKLADPQWAARAGTRRGHVVGVVRRRCSPPGPSRFAKRRPRRRAHRRPSTARVLPHAPVG